MTTVNREIDAITFGIYSREELLNMSVCKLYSSKKVGAGTVYDLRMGTTDSSVLCETCKENAEYCPGHFGHIELNEPIIHPLFYKRVLAYLKCTCIKCYRLLLEKNQITLNNLHRYKNEARFERIQEKLKKVSVCCHCDSEQPLFKVSTADSTISMVYDDKKVKTVITLSTEEIKKILDNLPDEDVELMGFDPKLAHPRNLVLTVLPVIPPSARPYVKADGKLCDDDLTNQYIEIIKANNRLLEDDDDTSVGKSKKEPSETKRQNAINSLKFRILTTFNNSKGRAKHTTNGRPIKGFKERLSGKNGLLRSQLMGRRCLAPETPVLMFHSGKPKQAKEIRIGDTLIGDDGKPRKVTLVASGCSTMYTVKQQHGEDYTVNDAHALTLVYHDHLVLHPIDENIWKLTWVASDGFYNIFGSKEDLTDYSYFLDTSPYIDITIQEYLKLPDYIKSRLFGVKLSTPVSWSPRETKIEPYMFGAWLICKLMPHKLSENNHPYINGLVNITEIPKEYIVNSVYVREQLLAGLFTHADFIEDAAVISAVDPQYKIVMSDIESLVKSLGLPIIITNSFKQDGFSTLTIFHKSQGCVLTNIEIIEKPVGKYCGFEVDQNNRFLLGDFTVTHNCNFSGRTVIGPDPTQPSDCLVIPEEMADILTVPVHVSEYNIDYLQHLVDTGQVDSLKKPDGHTVINLKRYRRGTQLRPGDIINRGTETHIVTNTHELVQEGDIVTREGILVENIKPANRKYPLQLDWIVDRKLQDDDYVLLNRQPTYPDDRVGTGGCRLWLSYVPGWINSVN